MDSYNNQNHTRFDYISGKNRIAILQHADIFILPTFWENFGIVVAEALSAGTPVITTTKTPWHDLREIRCGWTVEPKEEDLITVLKEAMSNDQETLHKMGLKGQNYVSRHFDWRNIAIDMKKYYEYILWNSDRPNFVHQLQGCRKPTLPIRKPRRLHELA